MLSPRDHSIAAQIRTKDIASPRDGFYVAMCIGPMSSTAESGSTEVCRTPLDPLPSVVDQVQADLSNAVKCISCDKSSLFGDVLKVSLTFRND
jgi:hypothetical protein